MSTVGGAGPAHRGLIYRGSRQLLEVTAPLVASTVADGGHVVVLSRRWYAAALREALQDRTSTPGMIDYRAARALSHVASADLQEQLDSIVHPYRPTLVISQFVPPAVEPGPRPCPVLASRSTTLLCVCPFAARDDLRASFHRAHHHHLDGPGATPSSHPGPSEAPTVRVSFGTVDDLSAARAQVARATAKAGFNAADRARAVLAIHEAMVLACDLVREDPETSRTAAPCRLQAYATPARLVAEIDLPRSVSFPAGQRDRDPLAHARAFCHQVSWFGSLRTRHIRLVTLG